jgi:regulator of sigma E protease
MYILFSILGAILALSIIIVIHEFGHYWVARRCGVFVECFSIGFGRPLYSRTTKNGMQFKIGWLPLGGYVKMRGDEIDKIPPQATDCYANKAVWQRMLIVLAGPVINFILAIIIYWCIYMVGIPTIKPIIKSIIPNTPAAHTKLQPNDEITAINNTPVYSWSRTILLLVSNYKNSNPVTLKVRQADSSQTRVVQLNLQHWNLKPREESLLGSLGIKPITPEPVNKIAQINPNSAAAKAGLMANDTIIAVNQQPVNSWQTLKTQLDAISSGQISISYVRDNTTKSTIIHPEYMTQNGKLVPKLGIIAQYKWPDHAKTTLKYNVGRAFIQGIQETGMIIHLNAVILIKLISGNFPVKALGGPVMIFQTAGTVTHLGIIPYLLFIAYISVAIGFMNLLPIPGLDGGHFLLQCIEAIRRKPLSMKWQMNLFKIGFTVLIGLIIMVTYHDIMHLF